jgi:hypothetical protein
LNASVHAPAPKLEAINTSRARPVMREANVSNETVDAARKRFMEETIAASDAGRSKDAAAL